MQTVNYNGDDLSKLSLGTVQFGLEYGIANQHGQPKLEEVKTIVDFVLKKQINCFDTATVYGTSEEVLGSVLDKNKITHVISKLKSNQFIENVEQTVESSLKKLQITTLYGLLLHDSKLLYSWNDEYTQKVTQLVASKKIRYFGVSIYTKDDFEQALENNAIQFIQIPFNIFDQRALIFDWFKKAKEKNKLIFIRSVFLQGLLLMDINQLPKNLLHAKKYLDVFERWCEELALPKNELALSFVNSTAKDAIILFGCDNVLQAEENVNIFNHLKSLPEKFLQQIHNDFKDVPEDIFNPTKWQ